MGNYPTRADDPTSRAWAYREIDRLRAEVSRLALAAAPAAREGTELWLEFHNHDVALCGLCGNTGWVDTRGLAISPAGCHAGVRRPCICPNGRAEKAREVHP